MFPNPALTGQNQWQAGDCCVGVGELVRTWAVEGQAAGMGAGAEDGPAPATSHLRAPFS